MKSEKELREFIRTHEMRYYVLDGYSQVCIKKAFRVGMAGEWVGGNRENVRRCCQFNRRRHVNKKTGAVNTDHKYMGIRFYYESDPIWMQKIKQ